MPFWMAGSDIDLLDPDEYFAEYDRRARERRERRTRRRPRRLRLKRTSASAGSDGSLSGSRGGRALIGAAVGLAVATAVGLIVLWPTGHLRHAQTGVAPTKAARVLSVGTALCEGTTDVSCRVMTVEVAGKHASVTLGPVAIAQRVTVGEAVRVSRASPTVAAAGVPGSGSWEFVEIDRHSSLLWLAAALLVLAVIVIRWRGVLAAVGVALSLLLITEFLVPAILDGEPALLVALVCALAVMFVTLVLTNGLGPQTLAAALGIGITLLLTGLLALLVVNYAHIDGRTDELSAYLGTVNRGISLQGIVLAGMVIGALGVLADTAVTQASAVMALRHANPELSPRQLYRAAFAVGRDHLSATIHTLVLAYVGASLPLLLIIRSSGVGVVDAINTQDIAEPIVAALVGCIGLVCAVPLTTSLSAVLVSRVPSRRLAGAHSHQH